MKKLLIACAVVAASLATIAFANQSPAAKPSGFDRIFASVTFGTNTNDMYFTKAITAASKNANANLPANYSNKNNPFIGGIQAGANLFTVNQKITLGAELDTNINLNTAKSSWSATIPTRNGKNGITENNNVRRYSIDPMVFIAYSPISQITLKGATGYGFQHATWSTTDEVGDRIKKTTLKAQQWKPVLAAEASYNINKNIGVLLGDHYTFGKKTNQFFNGIVRSNTVYTGIRYTL